MEKIDFEDKHISYMKLALEEAKKAYMLDEVPVGAVVIYQDKVIGSGYNQRETKQSSLLHAEMIAIDQACKNLGSWRLVDCRLYVTLEPCPMCSGAIINSRVSGLIYGASDPKAGSCGSVINLFDLPFNHRPDVISGVLCEESSELLRSFFKKLRNK